MREPPPADLFDQAVPVAVRVGGFLTWLEHRAGQPLPAKTAGLIAWLVETGAAKVPLWLIPLPGDHDADLEMDVVNPHFDRSTELWVDPRRELEFIVRFSDLGQDVAAEISRRTDEYEAVQGILPPEAAFESEEEMRRAMEWFGVGRPDPRRTPVFDVADLAPVIEERCGIPRERVYEHDNFRCIYLCARGVM